VENDMVLRNERTPFRQGKDNDTVLFIAEHINCLKCFRHIVEYGSENDKCELTVELLQLTWIEVGQSECRDFQITRHISRLLLDIFYDLVFYSISDLVDMSSFHCNCTALS